MAIKCKFTTLHGIELPEAYANIHSPQIVKQKEDGDNEYYCSAAIHFYANETAYTEAKIPVEGKSLYHEVNIEENILEQMYERLKEQEYIIEAEDC